MAIKMLLFGFDDQVLEAKYRDHQFSERLTQNRLMAFLGCVTAIVYLPIDGIFLSPSTAEFVRSARLYYMIPITLLWATTSYFIVSRRWFYESIFVTAMPIGWAFTLMMYLEGVSSFFYAGVAVMQVNLFFTVLLRLPASMGIPAMALQLTPFFIVLAGIDATVKEYLEPLITIISASILTLIIASRVEMDERRAFLVGQELQSINELRASEQRERFLWLQNLAGFLRHELRNAMVRISSSIELAKRRPERTDYLQRAADNINFMSVLLNRMSDATNFESSLVGDTLTPINVHELIVERIVDYEVIHSGCEFIYSGDDSATSNANEVRFQELLDKLVNNAVEHGDPTKPISISTSTTEASVIVTVANFGGRLPENRAAMFDLFTGSGKSGDHLGVGLFVAKKIAEFHGGTLNGSNLANGEGVEFIFSLPKV